MAMPDSIRSGWKPLRRLISTSSNRQAKAPTSPSSIMGSGKGGQQQGRRNHPHEGATAHPSSSGLAMGLLLTRCNRVPASASNTPAAPAASVRGKRHSSWACHRSQLGQPQPPIPLPKQQGGDHRRSQPQHHQANKASRRRMAGQLQGRSSP